MSTVQDPYRPPSAAPARPASSTGLYAGFWRRGSAYIIDSLILLIPCIIVGLLPILGFFLQIGIWATYKAVFEAGERQATPGKRAMGIKVTTLDGERISVGQALGRYFGSLLSGIILCIGYFMAGFTGRKQALHDMMASTLVVNEDATDEDVQTGAGTMPMTTGVWITVILFFLFPFGGGILAAIAIPAYQDYTVRSKMTEVILETSRVQPDAGLEIVKARTGTAVAAHENADDLAVRQQAHGRPGRRHDPRRDRYRSDEYPRPEARRSAGAHDEQEHLRVDVHRRGHPQQVPARELPKLGS